MLATGTTVSMLALMVRREGALGSEREKRLGESPVEG